ncbi:MAG: hypothetical protein JOY96_09390 [Verrucomicrobia bacterium]|nr:hypothetical protein [Verrucomicrobiota bacterium]
MTVLGSAVHEIDVMPWLFGKKVIGVNWMAPSSATTAKFRDPQVLVLELEAGALVICELFVKCGYGYEIRCEIVGEKGTIELAPLASVRVRSDFKMQTDFASDWRGRFAEAYRRELQSWVDGVIRWRSSKEQTEIGPVNGPDAWDGYCGAVVSEAVLRSMAYSGRMGVAFQPLPELYRKCRDALAYA